MKVKQCHWHPSCLLFLLVAWALRQGIFIDIQFRAQCSKEQRWRLYAGTSLISPCSVRCVGVFGNGALLTVCEVTYCLSSSLGCLEVPGGGASLAKNLIECNPIQVLETSFGGNQWTVGTLSPHYLVISVRLYSCMYIFRKFLLY